MNIDFNKPVAVLSGDEFLPQAGKRFAQQVLEYFHSQGGKAESPWGEVILDMKGIQSDKAHGIGRIKAASFAAGLLCHSLKKTNDRDDGSPYYDWSRFFHLRGCCDIQSERTQAIPA